jgi:hypothetical protein
MLFLFKQSVTLYVNLNFKKESIRQHTLWKTIIDLNLCFQKTVLKRQKVSFKIRIRDNNGFVVVNLYLDTYFACKIWDFVLNHQIISKLIFKFLIMFIRAKKIYPMRITDHFIRIY